ncbi:MAG: ribonuclease R [Clostridia bacterium]|nr:ribonuclease R [Clostridia bacterium]
MSNDNINLYEERKNTVFSFIKDKEYRPMRVKDIAAFMQVPYNEMQLLYDIIDELETEGKIVTTRKGKIVSAESLHQYAGTFTGNSRGFGFVSVEGMEEEIFIPASATNGAMHKDKVICRIVNQTGRRAEGEVVKVLEHGMKHIVGTYQKVKNYGFVIPDDKKMCDDIFIATGDNMGAVDGHKVLVKITRAPTRTENPEGIVTEILGHINDPGVDILSIIMQYDLPNEFPEEVYKEIEYIEETIDNEDKSGREDLRDAVMVTIDGEDAKDLDDAVSVERLENGNYKLGVYIADVSHYVREKSPLDKEAYKRGTSVYLVDRVIPMLPHKLSNGICSLNAGEDRFTLCCIMEIDNKGEVVSHDIKKAVINVNRRMSYTIVYDLLTNENSQYYEEYKDLVPMFKEMEQLRNILLRKRQKRGAIEFESEEAKILLDENGKPIDIVKRERNTATSIIEEFMLIANETVAEHFYWLETPFVYRTHEVPDEEKYEKLQLLVAPFGYVLKGSSKHPKSYQQLLMQTKDKPEEMLIHRMTLRSMKQAKYTADNGKHFGLAATYYCHFTSPIRRYPDLQIHRIISEYLKGDLDENRINHYKKILTEVARLCSVNERRAEDAERDTDKYKIVEFMQDKIGQEFEGIISSVTSWGIYVELPNTVEGMVSVKDLDDDYYDFDEENMRYIGENTNKTYTIGDKVRVILTRASLETRTIDFEFAEEDESEKILAQFRNKVIK